MNTPPKKITLTGRHIQKPVDRNTAATPHPVAPPAYRPFAIPLVLQRKTARPPGPQPGTKDAAQKMTVAPHLPLNSAPRSRASVQCKPSVSQQRVVQLSEGKKSKWGVKTKVAKNAPVVLSSESGTTSYGGLQYGEKITLLRPYLESTYPATQYKVNYAGHTERVYDIGGNRWGYIDTSHGEIEVLTAGVTSGTTLGYIPLRFTYTRERRQLGSGEPYDVTNVSQITEAAFIAGKTHEYNLFT